MDHHDNDNDNDDDDDEGGGKRVAQAADAAQQWILTSPRVAAAAASVYGNGEGRREEGLATCIARIIRTHASRSGIALGDAAALACVAAVAL